LEALHAAVDVAMNAAGGHIEHVRARLATEAEIALVHPQAHIDAVRQAAAKAAKTGRFQHLDADTVVSPASWDAALAAAGSVLTAVDALAARSAQNAFCLARPPGHHATADRAMGFCLFNNVAIGTRYAQSLGMPRALIVDWDVHHGNGTEAIFYEDGQVFYLSMHQAPHYPGTGQRHDRGRGDGTDLTLNLPVPPGLPAAHYAQELERAFGVSVARLRPDIIFISAGFDPAEYHSLTRSLTEIAQSHCEGRVVSVLEGGYDLENLTRCGLAHVRGLAGLDLS
jgi:acetoin utilization deacetylase AcuC-like enzyme